MSLYKVTSSNTTYQTFSFSSIIFKNEKQQFVCVHVVFFLLTDKNPSNENMQEAPPGQGGEVKVPDAPKQRPRDDGTAGAPESSSERPQPPTKALVSVATVCVVSAAAPMLISHTSHFLTASLTHLLAACADINFSLPNTHSVRTQQTRTHRRSQHTHTHSQADNICRERGAETRGVFFLILRLISACQEL